MAEKPLLGDRAPAHVMIWDSDTSCLVPDTVTPIWGAQDRSPVAGSSIAHEAEEGFLTKKKLGTSVEGRSPMMYWSRAL